MTMRIMMRRDGGRDGRRDDDRYEYDYRRSSGGRSRMRMEEDGGRYEARRLPPRNRYGEFRRRRHEYNDDHEDWGYRGDEHDDMGRRRYREDDWQTQGFVDPERERRYYEDENDRERRRERRSRREREYYDDDDGYD